MKPVWWLIPAAAVLSVALAAAGGEEPMPAKLGLWTLEHHSNMPIFLAGTGKTPQETMARSEAMLQSAVPPWHICMTEETRHKMFEQRAVPPNCAVPAPKFNAGQAVVDGTCGTQRFHILYTAGPDGMVRTAHTDITDTADPIRGGTVDAVYESSAHVTVAVTLNRQENGVHMMDRWDYRWVSADCGDLKPGEVRWPK